jgi:hypothetical protein
MELAIPLLALGGLYVISNQSNKQPVPYSRRKVGNEGFTNNKKPYIDQTYPENYPVMNDDDLLDTDYKYANPNTATDKYFKQTPPKTANTQINERDVYSLSGDYLAQTDFKHNNMVPFYGAKMRGQQSGLDRAESTLDSMNGSGSQMQKKVEQAPLFKPESNMQWTVGAPNMSDFYQSRQNPALRNNMVKPFESVQVAPGLNKGYGSEGSGGFNSGLESREMWLPKTVDEMRVDTNPKNEYSLSGHQGPAGSFVKELGSIGKVEKHLPDQSYENTFDRWLKTTGSEKASRNVAEEVMLHSNRVETTQFYAGSASATMKTASYNPGAVEESKSQQLSALPVAHSSACGKGHSNNCDAIAKNYTQYTNTRTANQQPQLFGSGFSRSISAAMAPLLDVFRPSKKEEQTSNVRVYGNIAGEVPSNYVLNPRDRVATTIKETTLHAPNTYIGNQKEGGYLAAKNQAIANQRDSSSTDAICGIGGGATKYGEMRYEAVRSQYNNELKEPMVAARTNHGSMQTFNPNMNINVAKNESDLFNTRPMAPIATIAQGTTKEMYGRMDMNQYNMSDGTSNRNDGDLLSAFKANPYTHSLTNIA